MHLDPFSLLVFRQSGCSQLVELLVGLKPEHRLEVRELPRLDEATTDIVALAGALLVVLRCDRTAFSTAASSRHKVGGVERIDQPPWQQLSRADHRPDVLDLARDARATPDASADRYGLAEVVVPQNVSHEPPATAR